MLSLTTQERRVILFLTAMLLAGFGIRVAVKLKATSKYLIMSASREVRIDLNKASLQDLLRTRKVSPRLAQKIIEYRDERGKVGDLQELKSIKGVGERRYEKLREILSVE